jgi:hypothetical protein
VKVITVTRYDHRGPGDAGIRINIEDIAYYMDSSRGEGAFITMRTGADFHVHESSAQIDRIAKAAMAKHSERVGRDAHARNG